MRRLVAGVRRTQRRIEERLGTDLRALVESQDARLVRTTSLSMLPSPCRQRAAFRLRFADGRVLKGRRLDTESHAERVERLSRFLDPRHFPRVLAYQGRGILTEWVAGKRLLPAAWTPALLWEAGTLQGALHRTTIPAELCREARERAERWRPRLERDLDELILRRALDRGEAMDALELASDRAPGRVEVGLGHGDFCAENIVVSRHGVVHVVDNENLLVHAHDYDLARTWYRWPMTPGQREAYYKGYRHYRDPERFVAHLAHWGVIVLIEAALFRARARTRRARDPLDRLRAVLGSVTQGTTERSGLRPRELHP